jgi:hypothetical protein
MKGNTKNAMNTTMTVEKLHINAIILHENKNSFKNIRIIVNVDNDRFHVLIGKSHIKCILIKMTENIFSKNIHILQ